MSMDRANTVMGSYDDKGEDGTIAVADTESINPVMRSEIVTGEFRPRILDDITLNRLVPLMSFLDLNTPFSAVTEEEQVIQRRLVYNRRVLTHSTETLAVVVIQTCLRPDLPDDPVSYLREISLYSMRDRAWCKLPRIPTLPEGIPQHCQCVSWQGKIFVLGGVTDYNQARREVYMLDVAGQRRWKQCASMLDSRREFGATVMDGKIYVFGGTDIFKLCAEVYDPKVDSWSLIGPSNRAEVTARRTDLTGHAHIEGKAKVSFRHGHQVAHVGEELFVHGGEFCVRFNGEHRLLNHSSLSVVYYPVKDQWRLTLPFGRNQPSGDMFSARGKFYVLSIEHRGIYVLDSDMQLWTFLQSCSFPNVGPTGRIVPYEVLLGDGELLVLTYWESNNRTSRLCGPRLLQSRGFGRQNTEIAWRTVSGSHYCENCARLQTCFLQCCIQL